MPQKAQLKYCQPVFRYQLLRFTTSINYNKSVHCVKLNCKDAQLQLDRANTVGPDGKQGCQCAFGGITDHERDERFDQGHLDGHIKWRAGPLSGSVPYSAFVRGRAALIREGCSTPLKKWKVQSVFKKKPDLISHQK